MANENPPRGGVVDPEAEFNRAQEMRRGDPYARAAADAQATHGGRVDRPIFDAPLELTRVVSEPSHMAPGSLPWWVDSGPRPFALVAAASALFYCAVMQDEDQRPGAEWGWVLAATITALAGAKTVERNKIGAPAGLIGVPSLVSR